MNTSVKHEKYDLVIYIGIGASKALTLYPFWSFKGRGKVGAFGHFKVPRGEGAHLGLFGFQYVSKPSRLRAATASIPIEHSEELLQGSHLAVPEHSD